MQLPCVQVWDFWDIGPEADEAEDLEFRQIYHGQLRAATTSDTRVREKHYIRKELHKQLNELWNVQSPFQRWRTQIVAAANSPTGVDATVLDCIAHKYEQWGYRFVPAIDARRSHGCELDIFPTARSSRNLVKSGGDIDNRLKTLFDALRMPVNRTEVERFPVAEK